MGRNKIKIAKQAKINETKPQIPLTKEQKVRNIVNRMNNLMYQSLETGKLKIHDPHNTAKNLINNSNKFLISDILNGKLLVNQTPINLSKRKLKQFLINEYYDEQNHEKIATNNFLKNNSNNQDLKQLYEKFHRQKQLQKYQQKQLQQKARQFIVKVQKQKQQLRQKLKIKKSHSRLSIRAYSEDTIRIMKQKLEEKIKQKKKQLTDKIQSIQKRKVERVKNQVNNQIQYWQKVKKYQSLRKLSVSNEEQSNLFPQIKLPRSMSKKKIVEPIKSRRYSKSEIGELSAGILNRKFSNIDNYVLKAKIKLQSFQNKQKAKNSNLKTKLINQSQQTNDLTLTNSYKRQLDSMKIQFITQKHKRIIDLVNKINIKRNDQQNVLKIRQQKGFRKQEHQKLSNQNNLQINASLLKPGKNLVQSSLQSSWIEILNKIKLHQMDKIKGLSTLSIIQKRLDKVDQQGILRRLKLKAQTIFEMENEDIFVSKQQKNNYKMNIDRLITHKEQQSQQTDNKNLQRPISTESHNMNSSKNQFIASQQIPSF